jgi:hypothetical protein
MLLSGKRDEGRLRQIEGKRGEKRNGKRKREREGKMSERGKTQKGGQTDKQTCTKRARTTEVVNIRYREGKTGSKREG